jgi:hypothetical protein
VSQPSSATTKVACDISQDFGAAQAIVKGKKVESVDSQVGENPGTNQPNGTDSQRFAGLPLVGRQARDAFERDM